MNNFLKDIVAYKKELLVKKQAYYEGLRRNVKKVPHTRYSLFRKAVGKPGRMNLIAEIKKASPSAGVIREKFDPVDLARTYSLSGAAAVSVLTEDKYFMGKPAYLRHVADTINLPVLTKDFIIHEHQILESFCFGASAVLLIAAILDDSQLKDLTQTANELDMDVLTEIHDDKELERVLKAGAEIIGINNRDLDTLVVDMRTSEQLAPRVPKDRVIVAESGITSHAEVTRLQELGFNAVLIGETFLRASDVGAKVREIMKGNDVGS